MKKYFSFKIYFVVVMILFTFISFGQTKKIDNLKASLYNSTNDQKKLTILLQLCEEGHSMNIDTLYYYASAAKQIATDAGDETKRILANVAIETWLERRNLFDSALRLCNADLEKLKYKTAGDEYAKTIMQKCYILEKSNKHKEALDLAYHFLSEAEIKEDTVSQIYCKCIIATVFRNMQQTDQALQWSLKAANTGTDTLYQEKKNAFGVYFLIGLMYNWKSYADIAAKDITADSILSVNYLDKGIAYSRQYENLSMLARNLCTKASGIGDPKQFNVELQYINEGIKIYNLLGDTISIINSITALSDYYMNMGQPQKGIDACLKAIDIAKRVYTMPLADLYNKLGECYKAAGDHVKYEETLNKVINLNAETYRKNSENDLAYLNAKYEDQKKENTIIGQQLDIASKKNTIYAVSILSGLLLIGVFFLYRYYSRRQKEQKQKEVLRIAAAEEAERKRISADLHDNIGAYAAAAASTIATINPPDLQSRNTLSLLKDNVQDMITQLNDSIWALNKKAVHLTGISDRFKLFIQKLEHAYPDIAISINEEIEDDRLLSPFQALHLFRIMQEALNNALRHSKCHNVNIIILSNKNLMHISIADDGVGMEDVNLNGNGINNLKTRASESGWQLEWINNKDGGTSVVICTGQLGTTTN